MGNHLSSAAAGGTDLPAFSSYTMRPAASVVASSFDALFVPGDVAAAATAGAAGVAGTEGIGGILELASSAPDAVVLLDDYEHSQHTKSDASASSSTSTSSSSSGGGGGGGGFLWGLFGGGGKSVATAPVPASRAEVRAAFHAGAPAVRACQWMPLLAHVSSTLPMPLPAPMSPAPGSGPEGGAVRLPSDTVDTAAASADWSDNALLGYLHVLCQATVITDPAIAHAVSEAERRHTPNNHHGNVAANSKEAKTNKTLTTTTNTSSAMIGAVVIGSFLSAGLPASVMPFSPAAPAAAPMAADRDQPQQGSDPAGKAQRPTSGTPFVCECECVVILVVCFPSCVSLPPPPAFPCPSILGGQA